MARLFVAVELSPDVREKLAGLQQELRRALPSINWVRPESIHLTLKFLGSVESSAIGPLLSVLESVGNAHELFALEIQGLGVFPKLAHPRILWAGLHGTIQALDELVLSIEAGVEPLGFSPEEKHFHPHLTLARIKREHAQVGATIRRHQILERDDHFGSLAVDRLILFQSDLSPHGATYTALGSVPLAQKTSEQWN